MRLTFLGATHEVTGSCFYLEACGKKILIDCGMEQGPDTFENAELPVKAGDIDMVLLTHAHMDHSGKLPLLYKQGFGSQVLPQQQRLICVRSCCATVRISRCLRQNGRTEREKERGARWWCRFMIWTMRKAF